VRTRIPLFGGADAQKIVRNAFSDALVMSSFSKFRHRKKYSHGHSSYLNRNCKSASVSLARASLERTMIFSNTRCFISWVIWDMAHNWCMCDMITGDKREAPFHLRYSQLCYPTPWLALGMARQKVVHPLPIKDSPQVCILYHPSDGDPRMASLSNKSNRSRCSPILASCVVAKMQKEWQ